MSCEPWTAGRAAWLSLVLLSTTAAHAAGVCTDTPETRWTEASGGNGHFYQVVCGAVTWAQANAAATAAGGHLATIQSSAENAFVFSLANDPSYWTVVPGNYNLGPWLGGFQPPGSAEPNSDWTWVTGEQFAYTGWHGGEPNNDAGKEEDRILYFNISSPGRSSNWNDTVETDLATYVIEWPHSLDVDGDGETQPLTDGLLFLRYLFGFTGTTLVSGAVDEANCTRCSAAAIKSFLDLMAIGRAHSAATGFSDAANPAGPWSYRAGSTALPHQSSWLGGSFNTAQPAWANAASGAGHIPAFFKSNGTETFVHDYNSGDLVIHSRDEANGAGLGEATLRFTAPFSGIYRVALEIWIGREIGRSVSWTLSADGAQQGNGTVASGDGFSRANPARLAASVTLDQGDVVDLVLTSPTTFGDLVGVNLRLNALGLDVDGNGQLAPLTDGLLLLRYLFGFSDAVLITGAVDLANCTRCTGAAVKALLDSM